MRGSLRLLGNKNLPFKLYGNRIEIPAIKTKTAAVDSHNQATTAFHYSWLRDNCRCSLCFHPKTRQKLHSSGSINPLVKPRKVELSSNHLKVDWDEEEGHKSNYDLSWLEKYNYNIPNAPLISPVTWNAKEYRSYRDTVDYQDFLQPQGYTRILEQLRDYGLAFLKNVPTSNHLLVEDVAKKFGVIKNTFYGTSWDVKNDPNSKNIAYTSLFLGLHMDLCYFEAPPGLQLLHCLENNVTGGTSIFHDIFNSVERLRKLHPTAFDTLTRVPVTFHYDNDGKHFEYHRPTINVDDLNDSYHVFYSPPFQGPLRAANPDDIERFYEAFSLFEGILLDKDYMYEYLMRPGDLVLFANRRVLHGRDKFNHQSGSRWLKGTYVGWDEVKDRIRVTLNSSD